MTDAITITVPRDFSGTLHLSIDAPAPPAPALPPPEQHFPPVDSWLEEPLSEEAADEDLPSVRDSQFFDGTRYHYQNHHTPQAHLAALDAFVRSMDMGNLLQMVVLNEWSGEVAPVVAKAATNQASVVYAISDWQGSTDAQRESASRGDDIRGLFRSNAASAGVKEICGDPAHIAQASQHAKYDLIVVYSCDDPEELRQVIKSWKPHLSDTGFFLGQAVTEAEQNAVAKVFGPTPELIPDTSIWYYGKSEVPG